MYLRSWNQQTLTHQKFSSSRCSACILSYKLLTNSLNLQHQLLWIPVEFRIMFKFACLTCEALAINTPTYFQQKVSFAFLPAVCELRIGLWVFDWVTMHSSHGHCYNPCCCSLLTMEPITNVLLCTNSFSSLNGRLKAHYLLLAFKHPGIKPLFIAPQIRIRCDCVQ